MRLLGTGREDAAALAEALHREEGLLVICLCADWCYICNEFRPVLARMAEGDAPNRYVWLDVEDEAELADDIEIDDFPTFAVYRRGEPVFFGATRAREAELIRLLAPLAQPGTQSIGVPEAVAKLPGALAVR